MNYSKKILLNLSLLTGLTCLAQDIVYTGGFWTADRKFYGDGRIPSENHKPTDKNAPHGFILDYKINIPETGWYTLWFQRGPTHDANLDGKFVYLDRPVTGKADKDGYVPGPAMWIEKGSHELELKRTGRNSFPMLKFDQFQIRKTTDPAMTISAIKAGHDAVRMGESFPIEMTAGGNGQNAEYVFKCKNLKTSSEKIVQKVMFKASSKPETKILKFKGTEEGVFQIFAYLNGKKISDSVFPSMVFAVVDTKPVAASEVKKQLIAEIDCVKQTYNGKPISAGRFFEANGPTRVVKTAAGAYRESHDGSLPETKGTTNAFRCGFAYRFEVPEVHVPYMIEVEYPDDTRRSATVAPYWYAPGKDTMDPANNGYQGKGYETGGFFPISNQTKTLRLLTWAMTKEGNFHVFTEYNGVRCALSKIRIYRFENDQIPGSVAKRPTERLAAYWYEEGDNWKIQTCVGNYSKSGPVNLFEGQKRLCQMLRFYGVNSFSGMGAGYQGVFWHSKVMEGHDYVAWHMYEQARLAALFCEKYGMKFIPEFFTNQRFLNQIWLARQVKDPTDLYPVNCFGARMAGGSCACDLNPLHPLIQKTYIDALGELADSLRDSPAFGGISCRADAWQFKGYFFYPSLSWGYGMWTIREFEKDTGIKVPNHGLKPEDHAARYQFLTSPAMKAKWIAWRAGRIADYHKRIVKRISGSRNDIFFGIAGSFDCDHFKTPGDPRERALECGVDISKLAGTKVSVIPVGRYGSRDPISRHWYDYFFNQDNVLAGMGDPRAFASYMIYMENAIWPADKLGIPPAKGRKVPYYCSSVHGAGRCELEKYAVVIAEQDTAYLREGGNADCFSDPEITRPFFEEYRSIPNVPFLRAAGTNDPVAVWYKALNRKEAKDAGVDAGLYIYAVNRERVPVSVTISAKGVSQVKRLTNGQVTKAGNGSFTVTLPEYGIVAWKADKTSSVVSAVSVLPPELMRILKDRLVHAELLAPSGSEKCRELIAEAWKALIEGKSWRARAFLNRTELLEHSMKSGNVPEDMLRTKFPEQLKKTIGGHYQMSALFCTALDLEKLLKNPKDCILEDGVIVNPDWKGEKMLWSKNGVIRIEMNVPAEGDYQINLGIIAAKAGMASVKLNGVSLPVPMIIRKEKTPGTASLGKLNLKAGKNVFELHNDSAIGLYGLEYLPIVRPIPADQWKVTGPFSSDWGIVGGHGSDLVKNALNTAYPAEKNLADNAVFEYKGKKYSWKFATPGVKDYISDRGVDMPNRTYSSSGGINVGVTRIHSDRDRTAILFLRPDWWCQTYFNGERLNSTRDPKLTANDGGDFSGWQSTDYAVLHLKKGDNVLLIRQHGGSLGSVITGWITDDPGIICRATEK